MISITGVPPTLFKLQAGSRWLFGALVSCFVWELFKSFLQRYGDDFTSFSLLDWAHFGNKTIIKCFSENPAC